MRTLWGSVVLAWAAVVPPALAVILPGGDRLAGPLELLVVAAALWGIVLVTGVRGLPWPLVVITAAAWVVLAAAAVARAIEHWPACTWRRQHRPAWWSGWPMPRCTPWSSWRSGHAAGHTGERSARAGVG
ncbi:hypothetical protein [Gordonia sp. NB41Y]|uniref:hypothetical protein n=1 Tax=Gordonia sp. NB41Y TaxID=875808 RepID=UPI00128EB464|nr:hypothetical protein [Gordonia sp. NB41Y]WLP89313.1 hypothetical protein Q9K23_17180 [Gordonia sp. NB41Y]